MYQKPVFFMHEEGISSSFAQAALSGINELLHLARASEKIDVLNLGVWRSLSWMGSEDLNPHESVDWYLDLGMKKSERSGQLNSAAVAYALACDPYQQVQPHYDVVLTNEDLYDTDCNFVVGVAIPEVCTIISVSRFLDEPDILDCIKTEVMHEVGHIFGLPSKSRNDGTIEQSLGEHCTNRCVMRQGLVVPNDWQRMTQERLNHGALCPTCQSELQAHLA